MIPDGYFLNRQAQPQPAERYADGESPFFRHLSTFPDRSTIKEAVLDLLVQAKQHVFFCNFLLQDEDVLHALLAAALRLSGHVYILTTLKADDFAESGEAGDDKEENFASHMGCVKQLTQEGLLVKARSDCHAKFMTVDDAQAIVTSANAVPTCYGNVRKPNGGMREANPENGHRVRYAGWQTSSEHSGAMHATTMSPLTRRCSRCSYSNPGLLRFARWNRHYRRMRVKCFGRPPVTREFSGGFSVWSREPGKRYFSRRGS